MNTVIADDVTVSVNQTPNTNTSITLTITSAITSQAVKLKNTFAMFSRLTNTGNLISVTKTLTSGVPGWINGTYDVSIYNLYFRTAFMVNNQLIAEDVV